MVSKIHTKIKDVVLNIPLNYVSEDEELFRLPPIKPKRLRKDYDNDYSSGYVVREKKVSAPANFNDTFRIVGSDFSNHKNKNVLIKNIANLSKSHLCNALSYAVENSIDEMAYNEDYVSKTAKEIFDDWSKDFSEKKDSKEALHLVFSIDEKVTKENMDILEFSVYETMRTCLADYKFAMIPHSHQNKPHIHIILNKKNQFDGKKLRFATKDDTKNFFFQLKEVFSNNLNELSNNRLNYKYENKHNYDILGELKKLDTKERFGEGVFDFKKYFNNTIQGIGGIYYREVEKIKNLKKLVAFKDGIDKERIEYEIERSEKRLDEIKEQYKITYDYREAFEKYVENYKTLGKKKKVLEIFKTIPKKLKTKAMILDFEELRREVDLEEKYIKHSYDDIFTYLENPIQSKENMGIFSLVKQKNRLKKIDVVFKNTLDDDLYFSASKKIKHNLGSLDDYIKARIKKIYFDLQELDYKKRELDREFYNTREKTYDYLLDFSKRMKRIKKGVDFMLKELEVGKKELLRNNAIASVESKEEYILVKNMKNQEYKTFELQDNDIEKTHNVNKEALMEQKENKIIETPKIEVEKIADKKIEVESDKEESLRVQKVDNQPNDNKEAIAKNTKEEDTKPKRKNKYTFYGR